MYCPHEHWETAFENGHCVLCGRPKNPEAVEKTEEAKSVAPSFGDE